ncbi:MAG: hypothetical protein ACLSF2_00320 [Butyricicoccus sp.]
MKRRILFVLIAVVVCVGAAMCFTSYVPVTDTAGIADVLHTKSLCHAEIRLEDITEQADTDAIRELLPQIRARRLPSYHRAISADCYQIQVIYGGKTVCFSLGEPSYAYEVTESMSPWVHKLSGGEKLLALLDEQ